LLDQPFRGTPASGPILRPIDTSFDADFFARDFGGKDRSTAGCAGQAPELLDGQFNVKAARLFDGHNATNRQGCAYQHAEFAGAHKAAEFDSKDV
jgi:hypothetical protein